MNFASLTDPVTPAYLTDVLGWKHDYYWSYVSHKSLSGKGGIAHSNLDGLCIWHLFGIEIPAPLTVGHLLAMCWGLQIPIPEGVLGADVDEQILEGLKDIDAGRLHDHEDVKRELLG